MDRKQFSALKILVADAPYMAALTASMLRALGARNIVEAHDPRGVHVALAREAFNLMLIDDGMPRVDPLELTRGLRADTQSWNRHVPVLMTFTLASKARILSARDAGVTEFLQKPLSANIIGLRMAQALVNPRAFVEAPAYSGPDRRRRDADISGPDRRKAG
jgi:PleD family two-component response regulator